MERLDQVSGGSEANGGNSPAADEGTSSKIAPYRHDSSNIQALAQVADWACDQAESYYEASLRVKQLAQEPDAPIDLAAVRELTITFSYHLSANQFGSAQPGAQLGPLEGPSYPRALRDADEEVRALWLDLEAEATHALVKARCADIIFLLKLANPRNAAERAVRSYMELVGGDLRSSEQSDCLLRAWELARSVGLSALVQEISSAMLGLIEVALTRGEDPYVVVSLLDALTAPQRRKNALQVDPKVDDLLDRALLVYSQTHIVSQIAVLVRRRAVGDEERIRRASEIEVKAHLNDAEKAVDSIVIRAHLNDAASRARQLNLPDLEKDAVSRLQSAPAVEWKTIKSEVRIPNSLFRSYSRPFETADTWDQALGFWFQMDSPTGSSATNEATARDILNQSVVSRLATTIFFGRGDLPRSVQSGDDDEAFQNELVRVETMGIHLHGLILADALDLIKLRFGIPSHEDLSNSLGEFGPHPILARALAKSFLLYWVGEYEACVHLAVPKVEAAVRALLLELNEPVYRVSVGDSKGQFPGLGALLDPLIEAGFDPDWTRFLKTFLLGDGMNVRNFVAHGFMDDVSRETAALALRACSLLVLIASEDSVKRDSSAVKAVLGNPHQGGLPRSWLLRLANAVRAARSELRK
ncbi:hypothetical protein AB0G79_00615 [Streptomyces sp. NPDC020807]|uniref:DUF7380 domain-containing protein n=1 Tax=Streptomyces sp. NPDC020807 TaxID=3155119 RepID=UPI00340DE0C6